MKKHYLKPTTRVVMLKQCRILSGSPLVNNVVFGTPGNIDQIFWATEGIGNDDVLR